MGSSSPPKATRPPPLSTTNTSPPSLSAKSSSSALRSSPDSLNSRGGSPHSTTLSALSTAPPSSLGVSTLVAMDLSLPTVDVSFHKDDQVDLGYDGDTVSLQRTASQEGKEEGLMSDAQLQRNYLSGPIDELVESLPRPSPLSHPISALPSPAISTTSTSSALGTPIFELPPSGQFHHHRAEGPSSAYTPIFDSTPSRPRPRAFTLSHSAFGSFGTFPSTARSGPLPAPTIISRIRLFFLQLFANAASAAFLVLIVVWALSSRGLNASVAYLRGEVDIRRRRPWDTDEHRAQYAREKVVKDIQYYANQCGFDVIEQTVETKDGYLLKVFKVECLKNGGGKVHSDGRRGFPVLIQHGLFQSCGSFITSEERSLAFWLAEHGDYQVYLGNNRGVFDMGHVRLKRSDPRFWDYNIKELALYDLPAMVDHVRRETGYDKIAFIGHSQGNATMFCSLAQGMVPELGLKLSLFIALAPAVYAGPLTTGFPFGALKSMKWKTWRRWFGVLDFIPLMRISYDWTPSKPFGLLGYQMFAFLFNWTDRNWLLRRKAKTFRFTPSPVSSASIFWWTGYGGFSTRGCVLDPTVERWWDARFPPLSIHHGGRDYLVLTDPLLERLEKHEKDVRVLRVQKLDEGEHCDFFWHIDAPELCFHSFLEDIEKTRPRYIDEPPLSGASSLASSRANSYTDSHGHGAVPNGNARGLEKAGAGGARRGNKGGGGLLAPEGLRQGL